MLRRRLYYKLKPYLPWRLRNFLRRITAERLRTASRDIWPINETAGAIPPGWRGWPNAMKFAFVLTHDIEGIDGLEKCRKLAEIESANGFRSSFNFIPEAGYATPPNLRAWLVDNGFEVGVHDLHHDGELYLSRKQFLKHAKRINGYIAAWKAAGFRSGFMLRELDWIHELDIEYDSSTFDTDPFEPQSDAAGTIFPFWRPSPIDESTFPGYVELPYTLPQDSTLYLILRERDPSIWLRKLDWVAKKGGMALVNVHPDYLRFQGEPSSPRTYPVEHYITLLKHVRDSYSSAFWNPLPREVATYIAPQHAQRRKRKSKKIGIITYSFFEQDSRVLRYGKALAQRGDEVEVLSLRSSPQLPCEEIVEGCRVLRIQDRNRDEKSPSDYLSRLLRFLLSCSHRISRSHKARKYDLLHIHNVPDFLVFAGWRPKLGGTKIILDIHDIVPELFQSKFRIAQHSLTVRMLKLMERASAAFSDHIILSNHLWLATYAKRSAPPGKLSVLINYVDDKAFVPISRRRQDDRKIVIFPGGLQYHQGLDIAINSFPAVVASIPTAELHIYGAGPAKEALVAQTAALGLNDRVKFFGVVSTREISAIMANADLGVVPKRADSFGNEAFSTKIFEFMAVGVPVVASRTKIDQYYFTASVLRFFESGNSASLANEIIDLLRNPGLTREMTTRASAFAAANTWESRKNEYLSLVDRLTSES
jgi:glycosyltransferase involved in cell wall biosynthesis/peptidoglycan/xylan/chitin deacetylase (PgdA/CDA1 family)